MMSDVFLEKPSGEPTTIGKLTATGTGVCHDADGNELDQHGNIVEPHDKENK